MPYKIKDTSTDLYLTADNTWSTVEFAAEYEWNTANEVAKSYNNPNIVPDPQSPPQAPGNPPFGHPHL
jgi:hypothetical protein